jgi:RimJ/RimL family protein N-acetyltransferase
LNTEHHPSFTLSDGRIVTIRPVRPDDGARIQALVARLSPQSSYFRFLEVVQRLSDKQLHEFTHLDYATRMAFVAVLPPTDLTAGEQQIIAVARYVRQPAIPGEPPRAEVGIVVEDAYQGQGLGSRLLRHLTIYARRQGIQAFTGTVHPTNERILEIIKDTGLEFTRHYAEGAWEVTIYLVR